MPGGTNHPVLLGLGCGSRTPYPYDAYPQSCHNGTFAQGKEANHLPTTADCLDCHTTLAWLPATFDHANVTGDCQSCHNGTFTQGKGGNHFGTSLDCDACHTPVTWSPANYSHQGAAIQASTTRTSIAAAVTSQTANIQSGQHRPISRTVLALMRRTTNPIPTRKSTRQRFCIR
jgi:hypothetical protein